MSRKKKPELNQSVITEELLDKVAAFYSSSSSLSALSSLSSLSSPDGDERGKSEVPVRDERGRDVKGSKDFEGSKYVKGSKDVERDNDVERGKDVEGSKDVERGKDVKGSKDVERSKDVKDGGNCASLREVAKHFNVSILKAKKLLITAGVYPMTDQIDLIQRLKSDGLTEKQIADRLGGSVAAVNASLPYEKVVYKLTIPHPLPNPYTTSNGQSGAGGAGGADGTGEVVSARTVEADRVDLHRRRWRAVSVLKNTIEAGKVGTGGARGTAVDGVSWREALWKAIELFQGFEFVTAGRGRNRTGATAFKYELKRSSRTGEETSELIISTRERGKTVTRSSVELALSRYLAVQDECGYVRGPKSAGQVFGGSYLYAVFLAWRIIRDKPEE